MGFLKSIKRLLILSLVLYFFVSPVSGLMNMTTVLLPEKEDICEKDICKPASPDNRLKVSADKSIFIKSTSTAWLQFNLKNIPRDAEITSTTLRISGEPVNPNPQMVRIYDNADGSGRSLGKWTTTSGKTMFAATSKALLKAVEKAHTAGQPLSLWLRSTSRLSDWDYYSTQSFGENTANKPRLIIAFTLDKPPVLPTETTSWRFYKAGEGFKVKSFRSEETILSNPVFYNGNVFLFAKPDSEHTYLYALHINGRERWHRGMTQTPAAHVRVNYGGILYSIGQGRIACFDLNKTGAPGRMAELDDFKLSLPPTLGMDSSLYFVRYGYAYGLNPEFQELWRYPVKDRGSDFSPITLTPSARKQAYVIAGINKQNMLTEIDAATGQSAVFPFDAKYIVFHTPVVIPGTDAITDYICLAANSQSDGLLECYADGELIWRKTGPVSQPVSARDGSLIFAVQNGRLKAFDRLNGAETAVSDLDDLAATSNPVVDGDDNVYFWNNGTFYVFDKQCKRKVSQKLPELAEKLELVFAPDGTLFARNLTSRRLDLILPALDNVTVNSDNLQNKTVYSANNLRIAPDLLLDRDMEITLKAGDGISLGRGFTVKKGAVLTCKTGY